MPRRAPHDPFTDAPLRPMNANPALRDQTSQQILRSNASTASARTHQPRHLFAPALSWRPTSRTTPRVEDEVLADPDSDGELGGQQRQQLRRGMARLRQGSLEGKYAKARNRQGDGESEMVYRQADGGFLLGVGASNEAVAPQMYAPEIIIAMEQDGIDGYYTAVARQFFTSGAATGGRGSKKPDEDPEALVDEMMDRLRQQAAETIESERWMYEPTDRLHTRVL